MTAPELSARPDEAGRHWVMPLFIACIIVLGVLVVVGAYWPR